MRGKAFKNSHQRARKKEGAREIRSQGTAANKRIMTSPCLQVTSSA
jgi:hypothetical protein